jgi:hypothetical protein
MFGLVQASNRSFFWPSDAAQRWPLETVRRVPAKGGAGTCQGGCGYLPKVILVGNARTCCVFHYFSGPRGSSPRQSSEAFGPAPLHTGAIVVAHWRRTLVKRLLRDAHWRRTLYEGFLVLKRLGNIVILFKSSENCLGNINILLKNSEIP